MRDKNVSYTICMTPHDALAEGRLADAIAIQETAVVAARSDPAVRRLLVDLLAFAGRFDEALEHLAEIKSHDPEWPEIERNLHRLFRSERYRSIDGRKPQVYPQPPPKHATRRWMAMKAIRQARPDDAVRCIDAADAVTPAVWGFLEGEYLWFAWEAVRKVHLTPATVLLDQLYRPATVTMKDNTTFSVHLPLVYPCSYRADDPFALGTETDHICPDSGPTRCVGGKLLLVGDSAEVPLRECQMIELR
jgi:type VI secretion system protein ImpE